MPLGTANLLRAESAEVKSLLSNAFRLKYNLVANEASSSSRFTETAAYPKPEVEKPIVAKGKLWSLLKM